MGENWEKRATTSRCGSGLCGGGGGGGGSVGGGCNKPLAQRSAIRLEPTNPKPLKEESFLFCFIYSFFLFRCFVGEDGLLETIKVVSEACVLEPHRIFTIRFNCRGPEKMFHLPLPPHPLARPVHLFRAACGGGAPHVQLPLFDSIFLVFSRKKHINSNECVCVFLWKNLLDRGALGQGRS